MVIAFIITIALFVFIYETINTSILQKKTVNFKINRSDITKPKFTINSENQKISISANEGNFLNNDEILLKMMQFLNQIDLLYILMMLFLIKINKLQQVYKNRNLYQRILQYYQKDLKLLTREIRLILREKLL